MTTLMRALHHGCVQVVQSAGGTGQMLLQPPGILDKLRDFSSLVAGNRSGVHLIHRTVDQHLRIAWSRASADLHRDVALLVVEGDAWMPRREYDAGRTLSRLLQATGWLSQLGLTDQNGLTTRGEHVLNRAQKYLEGRLQ